MVSIPLGANIPGADKAIIDIASKLKAFPNISCGFGSKGVYIVVIAKPKDTLLPLYVPVSGATVEGRVLSVGLIEIKKLTAFANLDGITSACIPILPTVWYEFRAKQYNVDFGNGLAQFSNWKSVKDVIVFEGKIDIPCVSGTFPINTDFPEMIPKVSSDPISINVPGYKAISPANMPFTVYINNIEIGSGIMTDAPINFTSPKNLAEIPELLASMGKSVTVKVEIGFSTCKWTGTKIITLPAAPCFGLINIPTFDFTSVLSKPTPPTAIPVPFNISPDAGSVLPPNIPLSIHLDSLTSTPVTLISGKEGSNNIDVLKIIKLLSTTALNDPHDLYIKSGLATCTIEPGSIHIPALIPVKVCTPPQTLNIITGECETLSIPGCPKLITTAETPSHPSGILDLNGTFYLFINKIQEVCESSPSDPSFITKIPKGTDVLVTLGSLGTVHIPLTNEGQFNENLADFFNFNLLAGAPILTGTPIVPTKLLAGATPTVTLTKPTVPAGCTKTGKIGVPGKYLVSLAEVQSYLNTCYPGGTAETVTGSWAGAFKITRGTGGSYSAGTYFWATTWEGIEETY